MLTRVGKSYVGPLGLLVLAPAYFIWGMLKFYVIVFGFVAEASWEIAKRVSKWVVKTLEDHRA